MYIFKRATLEIIIVDGACKQNYAKNTKTISL